MSSFSVSKHRPTIFGNAIFNYPDYTLPIGVVNGILDMMKSFESVNTGPFFCVHD